MKILFLDIDGTVLSHTSGHIPLSALQAIRLIRQQGVLVFGCTGRHRCELEKLPIEELVVDGWITMNGSLNYTSDEMLISSYPICDHDIHVLYDSICKMPFPCQFLEADRMYMNLHDDHIEKALEKIHSTQDPLAPLERILQHPVYMFIPWVQENLFAPIQKAMQETTCVRWNAYAVDCFSLQSGKNRGILDVLQYYHLRKEDAACIGDGENDLAMFEVCQTSIAMGNACDALKAGANYITDDIDRDGLAKAIKFLTK